MDALTPEQRAVVESRAHAVAVSAGAGTGKTFTIAHRVRRLVTEGGVPAHRILVLTFTREATASLARRLNLLLGSGHGVEVRSFHSFAAREMPDRRNFLQESDARKIAARAGMRVFGAGSGGRKLERLLRAGGSGADDASSGVLGFVSYCKNAESSPAEAVARQWTNLAGHENALSELWSDYVEGQEGRLDFDDLLLTFRDRLRDDADFRNEVAGRLDHLLVDEYQDVNRAQHEITLSLTSPEDGTHRPAVMVVGDDRQSIYGFRGSGPGHISEFLDAFPEGARDRLALTLNFRSQPGVLEAANRLFPDRDALRPRADAPPPAPPRIVELASREDEARFVADEVEGLIEGGEDPHEIVVLFRSRHLASALNEEIVQRIGGARRDLKRRTRPKREAEAAIERAEALAAVQRLTVHAAKGLEWDHVFLLGVQEGGLPSGHAATAPSTIRDGLLDEEKRLFYVAATRARAAFTVTYAPRHPGKAPEPSRFLAVYRGKAEGAAPADADAATA